MSWKSWDGTLKNGEGILGGNDFAESVLRAERRRRNNITYPGREITLWEARR
jgi:hypothetical protein